MSIIVDNILYTSSFIPKQIQKTKGQHDDILKKYAETKGCIDTQPITDLKSVCCYSVVDEIEPNRFLLEDGRIVGPLAFNKKCLNENKPFTVYMYDNKLKYLYDYDQHKRRPIYSILTTQEVKVLYNDPYTNPLIKPYLPSTHKETPHSRTYMVNGIEYKSFKELSKAYGISAKSLQYQFSKGKNLEEYINKRVNKETPRSRTYIVNGVEYKSFKALGCEYGISATSLHKVVSKGKNLEEYINKYINKETPKSRTYTVNGVEYKTFQELSDTYGISVSPLQKVFSRGENLEEYINKCTNKETPYSRTYIVNGVEYKSLKALGDVYGMSQTQLQKVFSRGENLEEYINKRINE